MAFNYPDFQSLLQKLLDLGYIQIEYHKVTLPMLPDSMSGFAVKGCGSLNNSEKKISKLQNKKPLSTYARRENHGKDFSARFAQTQTEGKWT